MPIVRTATLAALLPTLVACAPAASAGGFDSPNPSSRLYAIEQATRAADARPETLRRIVEQLDSDDDAVRMISIDSLKRLTGKTFGYRYYDALPARRAAIQAWVRYLDPELAPSETEASGRAGEPEKRGEPAEPAEPAAPGVPDRWGRNG